MFSNCSGPCEQCTIYYTGGCLAGNGDDDFDQITLQKANDLIARGNLDGYKINKLRELFIESNGNVLYINADGTWGSTIMPKKRIDEGYFYLIRNGKDQIIYKKIEIAICGNKVNVFIES